MHAQHMKTANTYSGCFLTTGGGGWISGTRPPRFFGKPMDPQMSHPSPTHPPTHPPTPLTHPPHYHRQNALNSAFGADPKSPTMAYPRGGGGDWKPTHPEILTIPPTHTKKNLLHYQKKHTQHLKGLLHVSKTTTNTSRTEIVVGLGRRHSYINEN